MTGTNDADSDLEERSQDSPSPETSTPASDKPNSRPDPSELWKQLEPFVKRELQSVKDTRIGKLESAVESFKPVLDRVKELIPADKFAALQRDLEFDEMRRRVFGDEAQPGTSDSTAGKPESNAAAEVSKVVDSVLQLPANDPRVTDLKLKHANDPTQYLSEALKLYAKIGQQEDSTPGEAPPSNTGGAAPRSDNPIASIDDPRELYKLAAQQMAASVGKKRRVAS